MDETSTKAPKKKRALKWLGVLAMVVVVLAAGVMAALLAAEKYTGRPEFCGTKCHIMRSNYRTWQQDMHSIPDKVTGKIVACVECHYKPGEKATPKAKFKGLGQLFSHLATGDSEVRKRPTVSNLSCSTAQCHPMDKLLVQKIDYKKKYKTAYKGELIPFEHKTHLEKTIDGQKLQCTSCHMHQGRDRHFEVPKELCFLCHFRNAKENVGRSRCAVCHVIPEKPLQMPMAAAEGGNDTPKKPITHKTLERLKISCSHCHSEVIVGNTALKIDGCLECHHDATAELLAKAGNRKLMHAEHVTKQTARCTQCHESFEHKKSSYLEAAVRNCAACHPEPHSYTNKLLAGVGGVGVKEKYPSLMHSFGTNCIGCHSLNGRDAKGNKVRKASQQRCAGCHHNDPKYSKMTVQWAKDVADSVTEAKQAETSALEAMEKAKGSTPALAYSKAANKFRKGQENLRAVTAGGGVHNKKYAMLLIDMAIQNFQEVVTELEPKGGTEAK